MKDPSEKFRPPAPSARRSAPALALLATLVSMTMATAQAAGIPVTIDLPKAGLTTVVIDDARGNRVRNLIAETLLPAGTNTLVWDGYDEGVRQPGSDDVWMRDLTRRRVAPGVYAVRALVHDHLALSYQFSVNSPGVPPWKTADGSGAWLADHSPAGDVLFLPEGAKAPNGAGPARFIICCSSGETGDEFVWLDENMRRLFGMNTGFWGGTHLARDPGPNAIQDVAAFTFISGERDADNNTIEVRAIKTNGEIVPAAKIVLPAELKKTVLPQFKSVAEAYGADGLAAYNGIVIFSVTRQNRVVFADARTRRVIGEDSAISPRGMTFDKEGRLWVVSGNQIARYTPDLVGAKLGPATPIMAGGLDAPRRVMLGRDGSIYVADDGPSQQVKVFTASGKLAQTIGEPGGSKLGGFDSGRLSHPMGMALDDKGRLWVTEAENAPRRLSAWNPATGALQREIFGPSQYGGGGKLDPEDLTRLYMDPAWSAAGVMWKLDWEAGTARPTDVFWRPDEPGAEAMPTTAPETAINIGGFHYLVDCYNDLLRYNQDRGVGIWRLDNDGVARPVVIIGNAADLIHNLWGIKLRNREAITSLWKDLDPSTVIYVWCDKNGDHIAEPEEVSFRQVPSPKDGKPLADAGLGAQILGDLSFQTTWGIRVAAPSLDSRGTPIYDLGKIDFVGDTAHYSERVLGGGFVVEARIGERGLVGGKADGTGGWNYQSAAGGQAVPGLLVEPTRLMGLPAIPRAGEAGPVFALNGDKGSTFLITMDGFFIQTIGGDERCAPAWHIPATETRRGMDLSGYSFSGEQFHPTFTQASGDGAIYYVVGQDQSSIARLGGLESARRAPDSKVTVMSAQLADLPAERVISIKRTARGTLTVRRLKEAPVLGADGGWGGAQWVDIDPEVKAAVAVAGDTLYAGWRTGDTNAVWGGAGDFRLQFKHGGALDLMIGPSSGADARRQAPVAGDERLLVTQVNGRARAVLYRMVAPDAPPGDATKFDSPVGSVAFDQVIDVSDQVSLTADGKGGFQIGVPLGLLRLKVGDGARFLGDIGLLRGDAAWTNRRLYWNNQDTGMVSDVPTEARLRPGNWGVWEIRP
jgi:hypothetical protein